MHRWQNNSNKKTQHLTLHMIFFFFRKKILNTDILGAGIISERFLNTEQVLQASRKESSKTNSPTYGLVSCEELCIQASFDHYFVSKHEINESQNALPCNSTSSVLLSVLLWPWFMQAARLPEEHETAFGVSQ